MQNILRSVLRGIPSDARVIDGLVLVRFAVWRGISLN